MKLGRHKQLDFPLNLWATVLDREVCKEDLPEDWECTLSYLLQTLKNDRERDSLLFFFRDSLTFEEIGAHWDLTSSRAREITVMATRRMRHPARQLLFTHGLAKAQREKPDYVRLHSFDPEMFPEVNEPPPPSPASSDARLSRPACLLEMSIDELDFSVRTWNCLRRANIQTLGDLLKYTEADLLRLRNLGQKCLTEISEALSQMGYTLETGVLPNETDEPDHPASPGEIGALAYDADRSELIAEIHRLRVSVALYAKENARLTVALDACRATEDRLKATQSELADARRTIRSLRQQCDSLRNSSSSLPNPAKGDTL